MFAVEVGGVGGTPEARQTLQGDAHPMLQIRAGWRMVRGAGRASKDGTGDDFEGAPANQACPVLPVCPDSRVLLTTAGGSGCGERLMVGVASEVLPQLLPLQVWCIKYL